MKKTAPTTPKPTTPAPKTTTRPNTQATKPKTTSSSISTNEQYLKKSLRLLGVTNEHWEKQTKTTFDNELFGRGVISPASSKQFFYIAHLCIQKLGSPEEVGEVTMWYPPRSVNEQIEFKKALFKLLQKLEANGTLPKNILLSKMVLMGETPPAALLQFLRILAELSLRAVYIDKYSKRDRLIQIGLGASQGENDVSKFYIFPFCESSTAVEPPIKDPQELEAIKQIFRVYIERYRKKILNLRTATEQQPINPQEIMSQILEQKQLAQTLSSKVSKAIYSQNRAFDRRVILDKNEQIWKELNSIQTNFIEEGDSSVLRMEGETSKLLANWKPASGTHYLNDFNSQLQHSQKLKQQCQQKMAELANLKTKILATMK